MEHKMFSKVAHFAKMETKFELSQFSGKIRNEQSGYSTLLAAKQRIVLLSRQEMTLQNDHRTYDLRTHFVLLCTDIEL